MGTVCLDSPGQASIAGQSLRPCWDATDQRRAFITSYNLVVGFHRGRKVRLRYGAVVVVILQGLCKEKLGLERKQREGEVSEKETEREERAPAGRQAVQPLPALGFLGSLKYASYF